MKTHLNASVAFYRTLLLTEPAKRYRDYALFVTKEPGLELALDLDLATPTVAVGKRTSCLPRPSQTEAALESASATRCSSS